MNKPAENAEAPQSIEREDAGKYDYEDCRPLRTAAEIGIAIPPRLATPGGVDAALTQPHALGEKSPEGQLDRTSHIDHRYLSSAFAYAAENHADQVRKGTSIAYISHLMSVSALVIENGGDTDQAIAGLLHDALEDCGYELLTVIQERFGQRVADIVTACTDGTPNEHGDKAPWQTRKEQYLARLRDASPDVLLVSACDKLHNARAVVSDLNDMGMAVFTRFKGGTEGTLWYYDELAQVFCERLPGRLAAELRKTVDAMLAACGRSGQG